MSAVEKLLEAIKKKGKTFEDMINDAAKKWSHSWENVKTAKMNERWIREKDVLKIVGAFKQRFQAVVDDFDNVNLMHHSEVRDWCERVKGLLGKKEPKP